MTRIGLISDTHGLLRPEALAFLRGCDHIVHGGDIGGADILEQLQAVAPVSAVRGNNDQGDWTRSVPETQRIVLGGVSIYAVHDIADLDIEPATAGVDVIVHGHSHRPLVRTRDGVLFVNPGSAGRRRFKLPVSVAELLVSGSTVSARLVELEIVPR